MSAKVFLEQTEGRRHSLKTYRWYHPMDYASRMSKNGQGGCWRESSLIQVLVMQTQEPEFKPQTHGEVRHVVCTCNPRAREGERQTSRACWLPHRLLMDFQISERSCLNTQQMAAVKWHLRLVSGPHSDACTDTQTWVWQGHTHTWREREISLFFL